MLYGIVSVIFRIYFFFIFRIKVAGRENFPKNGGFIICCNHRSNFDPPILAATLPVKPYIIGKAELFSTPLGKFFFENIRGIPVKRGVSEVGLIRMFIKMLKEKNCLMIFPQGTRKKDITEEDAKPGTALLAVKACVPVVPIAISGEYKFMSKIKVNIGEPIYFTEYYNQRIHPQDLDDVSRKIMRAIMDLID